MIRRRVIVENIEAALISSYGRTMRVPVDKAMLGARRGKWKILDGQMETSLDGCGSRAGDYLERSGFVHGVPA
jgi:hypothetical protein